MGGFFGGGGLYTLVAAFPALGAGRELFCCGTLFGFEAVLVAVLDWMRRLLVDVLCPDGCRVTSSGLAGWSLLVGAW